MQFTLPNGTERTLWEASWEHPLMCTRSCSAHHQCHLCPSCCFAAGPSSSGPRQYKSLLKWKRWKLNSLTIIKTSLVSRFSRCNQEAIRSLKDWNERVYPLLRNGMEGDWKDFKLGVLPERIDEAMPHRKASGSQSSMSARPLVGFLLSKKFKNVGRDGARSSIRETRVTLFLPCSAWVQRLH